MLDCKTNSQIEFLKESKKNCTGYVSLIKTIRKNRNEEIGNFGARAFFVNVDFFLCEGQFVRIHKNDTSST